MGFFGLLFWAFSKLLDSFPPLGLFPAFSGPRLWTFSGPGPVLGLLRASSQPFLGFSRLLDLDLFPAFSDLFWAFSLLGLLWAFEPLPSLFWASGLLWAFSELLDLLGPLLGFWLLSLFPAFTGPGGLFWAFSKLLDLFPGLFPAFLGFRARASSGPFVGSGLFWAFVGF